MSKLYELMEKREQELHDEIEELDNEPEYHNELMKELGELQKQMDTVWKQDEWLARQPGRIAVVNDPLPGGD